MRAVVIAVVLLSVLVVAVALFGPGWASFLLSTVLAKSLVVVGLMIMWRAGLVSFGHAMFYAVGSYCATVLGARLGIADFFVLAVIGAAAGGLCAFVLGFLLARYRGIFFANLNLAFSMLLYGYLVRSPIFGGTDGLHTLPATFLGFAAEGSARVQFLLIATAAVVMPTMILLHRFLDSTLGQMTTAILDNEIRVEYLGYPVRRAVHALVVIAGALAGAGGAMVALAVGHIDPDLTFWTSSGEFLFITILAGPGHVLAAILGTFVFELIRTYANEFAPHLWQMILGASLLLTMLFLPNGLWSLHAWFGRGGARHA